MEIRLRTPSQIRRRVAW